MRDSKSAHAARAGAMLLGFVLLGGWMSACSPPASSGGRGGGKVKPGDAAFQAARSLLTTGKFAEAEAGLSAWITNHPSHRWVSRARLLIGKSWIGADEHAKAAAAFEVCIKLHPASLEAHKSRYKLGMLDLWQGRDAEAKQRFAALEAAPDGPLVPEARAMVRYLSARAAGSGK